MIDRWQVEASLSFIRVVRHYQVSRRNLRGRCMCGSLILIDVKSSHQTPCSCWHTSSAVSEVSMTSWKKCGSIHLSKETVGGTCKLESDLIDSRAQTPTESSQYQLSTDIIANTIGKVSRCPFRFTAVDWWSLFFSKLTILDFPYSLVFLQKKHDIVPVQVCCVGGN